MKDCVFCDIINHNHKQSDFLVYEDELCAVFFDRVQAHPGHLLVVPKEHIKDIFELPEELAAHFSN